MSAAFLATHTRRGAVKIRVQNSWAAAESPMSELFCLPHSSSTVAGVCSTSAYTSTGRECRRFMQFFCGLGCWLLHRENHGRVLRNGRDAIARLPGHGYRVSARRSGQIVGRTVVEVVVARIAGRGAQHGNQCHQRQQGQPLSLIHISEPTRQAEISYAVFCLKKK